jgi:hypothetical protein
LPSGCFSFVETHLKQPEGERYKLSIWLNAPTDSRVAQVQLVRFPNDVILDKEAGLGFYTADKRADGTFDLALSTAGGGLREPPAEGLYLLNFRLDDGSVTQGWFVLDNLTSNAMPVVAAPAVGAHLPPGPVSFRWEDFRSSSYDPCESRRLRINIGKNLPQYPYWEPTWKFSQQNPTATSVESDAVAPGDYWVTVAYDETRQFGDLTLTRNSRTGRPITVGD